MSNAKISRAYAICIYSAGNTKAISNLLHGKKRDLPSHDFQIICRHFWKSKFYLVLEQSRVKVKVSNVTMDWDPFEPFWSLETSQARVLLNRCVQNTSKSITSFRVRAYNPTFSEIREFWKMQNFSSTRLKSDILWKQSRSEISAWASWGTGPKSRSDIGPSMSGFAHFWKLRCLAAWVV